MMRFVTLAVGLLAISAAGGSFARAASAIPLSGASGQQSPAARSSIIQPTGPQVSGPVKAMQKSPKARLDALFGELKRMSSEADAKVVADQIRAEWRESGSATIDLLMGWANAAVKKQDFPAALDFLDQVTVLDPRFVEGWNQRATVHFLMHDYAKSMADIERTLALEPRHFGALAGMAAILQARGKKALALKAYQAVLAVYPTLRQAQDAVVKLTEDLAGNPA